MFSKHGGHKVSVPEPCAYIPPSITQNRHAEDKLRQRPFPARPSPAQPLRPKAAPNPGASQQLTGLVYVTKPSVDELHIHWVKALEVLLQV